MKNLSLYARLVKVDEATRRVTGVIASETLDRSRELFDYDASKPHFEKWAEEFEKATDGKSLGNVRAMHGKTACGRLVELDFHDAEKMITATAEIVDDAEWNKVEKGLYTGFSIGGRYVRKWTDEDGQKRYEAEPFEVSIVDLPCNKDARFTLMKADGVTEEVAFDEAVTSGEPVEGDAVNNEGQVDDVTKAAEPVIADGTLRLTDGLLEKFSGGAWGMVGNVIEPSTEELAKSAYGISALAQLAEGCRSLCESRHYERWDSATQAYLPVTAELKAAALALYDALLAVVGEDVEAAKGRIMEKVAELNDADALQKRAVDPDTHATNLATIAAIDGLAKSLGMEQGDDFLTKIAKLAEDHTQLVAEHAELRKAYEAQPEPAKAQLVTVEKAAEVVMNGNDGSTGTTATASVDASPEELRKQAWGQALGKPISPRNF